MTRFSLIVPVYNAEKYLTECLDSLLGQEDAPAYEIICADDGSSDRSGAILDMYRTRFPEKMRVLHTENRGTIRARRLAIEAAAGEYCLFADADDRIVPRALCRIAEAVDASGADVVLFGHAEFRGGEAPVPKPAPFPGRTTFTPEAEAGTLSKTVLYEKVIDGWSLNPLWIKAIKRELLLSDHTEWARFADNPMSDDLLMSLWPLTESRRVFCLGDALYLYRRTPGGLTQTFDETRYRRLLDSRVEMQLRGYMDRWGLADEEHITRFDRRRLMKRIDTAMAAFRRAEGPEAELAVLGHDWFSGLGTEERLETIRRTLPVKSRTQELLIRKKLRVPLALLTRKH